MTTTRTIHIVDDEAAVRASLAFLLVSHGFSVQTHESGPMFLGAVTDPLTVCLLTDLRMPLMNGVELLEAVKEKGWTLPSIVITGHGDVPMAVAAMKMGASDFLEKPFADEILIDALKRACDQVQSRSPHDISADEVQSRISQLTAREREILVGIVSGLPNKTIAYDLEISPRTVEVHRANIMSKMQARSLADLVRMSLQINPATN